MQSEAKEDMPLHSSESSPTSVSQPISALAPIPWPDCAAELFPHTPMLFWVSAGAMFIAQPHLGCFHSTPPQGHLLPGASCILPDECFLFLFFDATFLTTTTIFNCVPLRTPVLCHLLFDVLWVL